MAELSHFSHTHIIFRIAEAENRCVYHHPWWHPIVGNIHVFKLKSVPPYSSICPVLNCAQKIFSLKKRDWSMAILVISWPSQGVCSETPLLLTHLLLQLDQVRKNPTLQGQKFLTIFCHHFKNKSQQMASPHILCKFKSPTVYIRV